MRAIKELEPVRDEFLIRFYRWAKEFSQDEFSRGFPLLSQIRNPSATRLVRFAESLNTGERKLLCSALLKRFHPRATELANDFLSSHEQEMLRRYSVARNAFPLHAARQSLPKVRFRNLLLSKLHSVLGDPVDGSTSQEWEYWAVVGCWTVSTRIDIGGRRVLGYEHAIPISQSVFLHRQISVLSWMGISSQTDWVSVSESELEKTLESIEHLCKLFMDTVPMLLNGLDCPPFEQPELRKWCETFIVQSHRSNGYTVVLIESAKLQSAFDRHASWEVPTSIIPRGLRSVGSRFLIIQDPAYIREHGDRLAMLPRYRHLRVEALA
jgi:hypothetical protein